MNKEAKYPFPVYCTQGGGLVKEDGKKMVFIEAPLDPAFCLKVGDEMPAEWGLIPANNLAQTKMDAENPALKGMGEYLGIGFLFKNMTADELRNFGKSLELAMK